MAVEIIMPKAGVDMQEGQIVSWKKKVGDKVEQGEILLEILTDKVNMELEAEESGYLIQIIKQDGETVPVTEIIGYLGEQGEKAPEIETKKEEKVVVDEPLAKVEPKEVKEVAVNKESHDYDYDMIIIGGGPAGYVGAIRAAQLGAKVAVIEKSVVGGTCLNRGCIPTKTYLKNAEIIEHINHAKNRGINIADDSIIVDLAKTVAVKNKVVNTLTSGIKGLFKSNAVESIEGTGVIVSENKVQINGDKIISAKNIILASGSKVGKINIKGIESKLVLTSDDILDLEELPESLAVIGGGVVGTELGQAFSTFGSKVTIVEMADRIIPSMDKEASVVLAKKLETKGMKILTSTKLLEIVEENGKLRLKLEGQEDVIADKALLSIGRVPDLEALGNLQFEMDRGRVKVDDYMETSIKGIYAPGDVNGIKMLAHAAYRMGEVAVENAIEGNHRKIKLNATPAAIYTLPEVGMVGLTEDEAREKYDILVGKFNFNGNGRAIASDEAYGFIKVIVDKKYYEILGVHIVGPNAAEIINEAASLVELEITVDEVLKTIHGHPTYSEALYEACADALDLAIHVPKKRK